ncbi:MAG TPA: FtsX-like permease family protein, partial [Chitinophagaceae bacterium]|nr:FtsX-like permease family protein [Chitinophagaceae bacterium]
IGKKVTMQLGSNAYVVGVVDNFNFQALHVPLGAYAFHNRDSEPKQFLLVRFRTGDLSQTMEKFRQAFKTAIPNSAFEYTFLDKELETLYATDKRMASVGLAFSILAIFVACLGLFGLAAYTAEQRIKEIGIRKVLGATVSGITALLTGDFIRLIIISLIIAFPLAFWAMSKWLQDFAYRIQIQWWIFLLAGSVAILIALITVGFQAVKAAVANPVKSLRSQ